MEQEMQNQSEELASCESCGMPLDEETTSKMDKRYCIYCQNQETGELGTYEQVREGSIAAAVDLIGKTPEEAAAEVDGMLKELPRWKQ